MNLLILCFPTHPLIQGQWWSYYGTHLEQMLQWCIRDSLSSLHSEQMGRFSVRALYYLGFLKGALISNVR